MKFIFIETCSIALFSNKMAAEKIDWKLFRKYKFEMNVSSKNEKKDSRLLGK